MAAEDLPLYEADRPSVKTNGITSDTSPLFLNQYQETNDGDEHSITAGTPVQFSSDSATVGDVANLVIPANARFVWIMPVGGYAMVKLGRGDKALVTPGSGSLRVPDGVGQWIGIPLTNERAVSVDMSASGTCVIVWGW